VIAVFNLIFAILIYRPVSKRKSFYVITALLTFIIVFQIFVGLFTVKATMGKKADLGKKIMLVSNSGLDVYFNKNFEVSNSSDGSAKKTLFLIEDLKTEIKELNAFIVETRGSILHGYILGFNGLCFDMFNVKPMEGLW